MKKNQSRNPNANLFILVCIVSILVGCRKLEPLENPSGVHRNQALVVQTRSFTTSQRTLPIDMQRASIRSSQSLTVLPADSLFVDSFMADRIFQDIFSQGSSLWGRYFLDGQYAYANNLRRYIEHNYALVCQKLFLFGDLTAISPHYGCCASWKYDVACVLRGKGGILYVLDPRLFTTVVSVDVWKGAHARPTNCVPQPRLISQALVAGEAFTPYDDIPSGYLVDSNYVYTDIMLGYYADSVGCYSQIQ